MKLSKYIFLLTATLIVFFPSCKQKDAPGWHDEVIYHVFQRSYYDSDGDRFGDLNGIVEKLDYLRELGVTAILLTPLYESDFYHNYFPINYKNIDPEYGTMDNYIRFVKAVHSKGLKFIMDMETQYVQNGNTWLDDSYMNPASEFGDYIYYTDSLNQIPGTIFGGFKAGFPAIPAWPDQQLRIAMLNLNHEPLRQWMKLFYTSWIDPNGDGRFDDGVDGFRLDHMMDDQDGLGIFKDLYINYWKPIIDTCRVVNPDIFIIGEQSDWSSYGEDMLERSTADACFGFPIRFAIAGTSITYMGTDGPQTDRNELDVSNMHHTVEETLKKIPEGKHHIIFIENHDMDRWASIMERHEGKVRCGAVLNILLPGIPSIYFGQELGVTGRVGNWSHDANHIPIREAFPWSAAPDDQGIALWYQDTGPWWEQSYFTTGETYAFALPVQKKDRHSLWNLYRTLLSIRKECQEFQVGYYVPLLLSRSSLFIFARERDAERSVVIMNVSSEPDRVSMTPLNTEDYNPVLVENARIIERIIHLDPYGFVVLRK